MDDMGTDNIKHPEVRVKLTGTDSNSFFLLGKCRAAAKKAGVSAEEIIAFQKEAMSGDCDHLLRVCCKWFNVR